MHSRLRVSPDLAFQRSKETAKYNAFILLDVNWYKNIYPCIRGFLLNRRHKDFNNEVIWMRHGVLLRHLAPLGKELFVCTIKTLLNKSDGYLVTGDELIGSRAKDVGSKVLSY